MKLFSLTNTTTGLDMPKFSCQCGYQMNLSDIPNQYEHTLIAESTIYRIGELLSEKRLSENDFYELTLNEGISAYRCPSCKRIHLEENGDNKFSAYLPEN